MKFILFCFVLQYHTIFYTTFYFYLFTFFIKSLDSPHICMLFLQFPKLRILLMEVVERCCLLQSVEMKRRAEEIFERVSQLNDENEICSPVLQYFKL